MCKAVLSLRSDRETEMSASAVLFYYDNVFVVIDVVVSVLILSYSKKSSCIFFINTIMG